MSLYIGHSAVVTAPDILLTGTDAYINMDSTKNSDGYGLRNNNGDMQFKHSGGAWADLGTGGGGGTTLPSSIQSDGATITVNFTAYDNFIYELASGATVTMGAPSNATTIGQSGDIIIKTGSVGTNTVNWASGSDWYFEGGTAPTITQSQGVYDIYSYLIVASNKVVITSSGNFIQG